MPFLNKLLSRLSSASSSPRSHGAADKRRLDIGNTINDALMAAGLLPKSPAPAAFRRREPRDLEAETLSVPVLPTQIPGSFQEHAFVHQGRTLQYKLFIPSQYVQGSLPACPLLVMFHGCTQSPDDFAAGTRMNELASQHGFLVVYPAQATNANSSKCWNWFRPEDQTRGEGEPALLAALTQAIVGQYVLDPDRVYVAGLSAGAAMAVILGNTYPDLYAAVGSHSGLPYRAAHDMPSAFAAMGGRRTKGNPGARADSSQARQTVIPMIIFHGDQDRTVAPSNAEALVKQSVTEEGRAAAEVVVSQSNGNQRSVTRTLYPARQGQGLVEYWQIHGAGHAWSGGSAAGSYTDTQGPDASAEMVRFFLQTRRP